MGRAMRAITFVLVTVTSFVAVANTAPIAHGALFVCLMPVYAYFVNKGFDWAKGAGK